MELIEAQTQLSPDVAAVKEMELALIAFYKEQKDVPESVIAPELAAIERATDRVFWQGSVPKALGWGALLDTWTEVAAAKAEPATSKAA